MLTEVKYTPSDIDLFHIKEIKDFFKEEDIPYVEDEKVFGIFHLNEGAIQLRYVNSYYHPIDNSKRFGDKCKGVELDYFINISHDNLYNKNIRTIWCFDFEMEQENTIIDDGGKTIEHYRRQWEVIKNTLRTACHRIHYRFYARDCEIRELSNHDARNFLDTNCFYGYRSANITLGVYLKKDKNGFKKGTLLMIYSFGHNFYGNKNHIEDPKIEIVRVSTKIECQVIGGASKCLTYFCQNYPTLTLSGKEYPVKELVFYVDASHNDGRSMTAMGFKFLNWQGAGFMNRWCCDYDGKTEEIEENRTVLKGRKGEIFHRKPMFHRHIMRLIGEGKIVSIGNAGTSVYTIMREEFLEHGIHTNATSEI